jgi:hypothetical protein
VKAGRVARLYGGFRVYGLPEKQRGDRGNVMRWRGNDVPEEKRENVNRKHWAYLSGPWPLLQCLYRTMHF